MNIFKLFAILAVLFALPFAANAKDHKGPMDTGDGRPLQVLMHDQIPIMSANYAAIIALGDELLANPAITGETRAALLDYVETAENWHVKSLGGWVPGTVTSDLNPFHKTYHGSLRATFHVLMIVNAHSNLVPSGGRLYSRLNDEMYGRLAICANTYDDITTASDLRPDWSRLSYLVAPSAMVLMLLVSGILAAHHALRMRRRPTPAFGRLSKG
jgi:hypothetical protein